MDYRLWAPATRRYNRPATSKGFSVYDAECFSPARENEDVAIAIKVGGSLGMNATEPCYPLRDSKACCQSFETRAHWSVPSDNQPKRGNFALDSCCGLEQVIHTLSGNQITEGEKHKVLRRASM